MPVHDTTRTRRTILTIAAAAAVVLLPTACDYAVATTGDSGAGYGLGSGHAGHGAPVVSDIETVPAGATEDLAAQESGAAEPVSDEEPEVVDPSAAPASGEADPGAVSGSAVEPETADPSTDTATADPTAATTTETSTGSATETSTAPPVAAAPPAAGGLATLGSDCSTSDLQPHTGFQESPRCVATAFGEVAAAALSPSLLITKAPTSVASGEAFTLTVSTRNLIRDRFLGAAAGGYYRESSFLDEDGVQRGHFHTACRLLPSTDVAPDAEPAPAFFLATQDNGGGTAPDQVVVPVTGIAGTGTLQCAVWAGDGSHRVPMMTRANQTPAFDVVRIAVG